MIPRDIKGICELFDCGVRHDISDPPGFKFTDPDRNRPVPVFAIGAEDELSAGLYGYTLTPWFYSEKTLARYCASKKGREEINAKAKETFPNDWLTDYQTWFDDVCDGCFDIRGINASEHKCHSWANEHKVSSFYTHKGERVDAECECRNCRVTK